MRLRPAFLALLALSLCSAEEEVDPARLPTKPLLLANAVEGQIALIGYAGAQRPIPGVTRTKEEALKLAQHVARLARAKGSRFDDIVRQYSEDPCKAESLGRLGSLAHGLFPVKAVEDALFGMETGQVSDPVDTPSGYVVAVRWDTEACIAQILVTYRGAQGASATIGRTKEEAKARAEELHRRVTEGKEEFSAVAREASDDPTRTSGGHVGVIRRGMMSSGFEDAAFSLRTGEVSAVIETPQGFHILKALPFAECSHILITFKGVKDPLPAPATLNRADAKKKAEEILKRLRAGENFAKLAQEASDDPVSRDKGGYLGDSEPGGYAKEFEDALYRLKPGETSDIVETDFGFHIIFRWR